MTTDDLEDLRQEWSTLYRDTLPQLARAKDPAQPKWPVSLDHCFARIILDNTVGKDAKQKGEYAQWDTVLKKPAVRNMSKEQLRAAIAMGHEIQVGKANLEDLDEISLQARGKNEAKYSRKRKAEQDEGDRTAAKEDKPAAEKKRKSDTQTTLKFVRQDSKSDKKDEKGDGRSDLEKELNTTSEPNIDATLKRIQSHSKLTDYRKRLYATLLTVPTGQYTTYQAMADFLDSSARAVGSGMRNNPFAPDVPCHRVLASDRSIGGFGGSWGADGKNADKKVQLLKAEGVKFDSTGKAKGPIFKSFKEMPV